MKSAIDQFRGSLPFSVNLAAKAAVVSGDGRVRSITDAGAAASLARCVASAREFFGERWQPGDVSISNDPDRGATHVCQLTAVAPLYRQGKLAAWGAMRSNVFDLGGWCPGGYSPQAIDRWAEAARFEPAKLLLAGKVRREVVDLLSLNSRTPKATRRIAVSLAESVLALDAGGGNSYEADLARARAALQSVKPGKATAPIATPTGMASPGDIEVRISGKLTVDLAAPKVSPHPVNLAEATTRDVVLSAVMAALGLEALQSGALLELVDVKASGLLAARVPACVGIGRETAGAALHAACVQALGQQKPAWRPRDAAGELDWSTGQLSAQSVAALFAAERQVNA